MVNKLIISPKSEMTSTGNTFIFKKNIIETHVLCDKAKLRSVTHTHTLLCTHKYSSSQLHTKCDSSDQKSPWPACSSQGTAR